MALRENADSTQQAIANANASLDAALEKIPSGVDAATEVVLAELSENDIATGLRATDLFDTPTGK
jgi:hypothetical protein